MDSKKQCGSIRSKLVADTLFIVTFAMYLFCSAFHFSTFDLSRFPALEEWITSSYEIVILALLVVVIILRRWRWSPLGLIGIVGMLAIFTLSSKFSATRPAGMLLLFLLAMCEMDFLPLVKVSFWTTLTLLVIFLLGTRVFGMPECWDLLDGSYTSGRGTVHPNAYSILLFNLTLCMVMLVDRKHHFFLVMTGIMASTVFVYSVQHSDTTFILLVLLAVLVLLERWWPILSQIICRPPVFFVTLAIVACSLTAFMLLSAAFYSPDNYFLVAANRVLHGRIALPSVIVHDNGGYPIFGQPLTAWTGSAHASRILGIPMSMLDSAYIRYALVGGLFMVICALGLFLRAAYVIGNRNPSLFIWGVFIIFLFYMVMEYDPSNLCFNATLPLLVYGLRPWRDNNSGTIHGRERL